MGLLGRLFIAALGTAILALVGVQYAHVIGRNVALARELHTVQRDVVSLRARQVVQKQEIRRLSDPQGAIPEIHDRLHLVRDKEEIIYLEHGR
jgi:cell division protein FtsB